MREFRYSALTSSGRTVTGVRRAPDAEALAAALRAQGQVLLNVRPALGSLGRILGGKTRKARKELRDFTQHMATCLGAGVPALTAITDYQAATRGPFAEILADVAGEISSGAQIDEAFARYGDVFPPVYLALIESGQESGGLDKAFEELTAYIEWQGDLRSQTTQALVYPAMLLTGIVGLFLLMILFVVPRFEGIFNGSGLELPGITLAVMALARFTGRWWWAVGGAVAGLAIALRLAVAHPRGAYLRDRMLLSLPVIGAFQRKLALSRFSKSFSLIFASGVDLLRLLNLLTAVVDNRVMAAQLTRIRQRVSGGQSLTEAFAEADVFPPMVQRMIAVGEKTGSLDATLLKVSAHLDKEIPRDLKKTFTVFEGVVLVLLGLLVCVAALSLLMPIMSIRGSMH
jgi:type II secretory pathway component PulF